MKPYSYVALMYKKLRRNFYCHEKLYYYRSLFVLYCLDARNLIDDGVCCTIVRCALIFESCIGA